MGKYDHAMKLVVAANPQAIAEFILNYAEVEIRAEEITVVAMLNTEFEGYEVDADGLLLLRTVDEEEILLHIEFQSTRDKDMPDRQIEYSLRARKKTRAITGNFLRDLSASRWRNSRTAALLAVAEWPETSIV